jgi:hypothetical protein
MGAVRAIGSDGSQDGEPCGLTDLLGGGEEPPARPRSLGPMREFTATAGQIWILCRPESLLPVPGFKPRGFSILNHAER